MDQSNLSEWGRTPPAYRCGYAFTIALVNLVGFIYYLLYFLENGYLPSPFVNDKYDTLMDLFNPLYWTYDTGRYTEWGSVYPPLNFWILKLLNFTFGAGLSDTPFSVRENSKWLIAGFCLIYFTLPVLILKTKLWRDFSPFEKLLLYFAVVLSTPALFALERGNLIILCPILLALVLSKIGILRCFCIALLINIKPYFLILAFYYLARRSWRGLIVCLTLSGLIFLFTGLALDENFHALFKNLLGFSREEVLFSVREVMSLPSSISVFSYTLTHPDGASFAASFMSESEIALIIFLIDAAKWVLISLALWLLMAKSQLIRDAEIFTLLVVCITNLGVSVGGYSLIFYVALTPILMRLRKNYIYIILMSLLAAPLDIFHLWSEHIGQQYSYLSDALMEIEWSLGLGSVTRPLINFFVMFLLCCEFYFRVVPRSRASLNLGMSHSDIKGRARNVV